ncbi:MAG: hypothetical protein QG552_1607, partial [Thermodesulfobacteriota bacterium]|nr:hypothetical protein [Thermodesulfobacteriota bacterium]
EAENMAVKTPGQPLIRIRYHEYWGIFKNNLLAQDFEWRDAKEHGEEVCVIEERARCRMKQDVTPRMRVVLDGGEVGECDVDEAQWRLYRFGVRMSGGKHRIEVQLTNNPDDAYNYRYLHVDYIRISAADERR